MARILPHLLLMAAGCSQGLETRRLESPPRTEVTDPGGAWLATFTDGARTVTLRGPARAFAEPSTTAATVTGTTWVRLLPAPFAGRIDEAWLDTARADRGPDILAIAMEYTTGGALDASYGPLVDGVRQEGADFYDFLGVDWRYPSGSTAAPDPAQLGSLDCSGYQRMVWGYRGGLPLVPGPSSDGGALPRRSFEIYASAPGVVLPADLAALAPGDLVFHDADGDDGAQLDHVGIYLGVDDGGRHRFVSSRKTADGPTMGDLGGAAVLDGSGLYARSFRAARRL